MLAKYLCQVLLPVTAGLTIAAVGAVLAWYQVLETELTRTAIAARETVLATERLLDEARHATELARPMMTQPCTPKTELS